MELYRFRRRRFEDCTDAFEQLCWSLKNMQDAGSAPEGTLDLRLLDLWHAGEIAAFPKEKREKYDTDMITEWDHENMMYSAEMKGRKEGLAEGEAKGKAEVARAMLAAGMPVGQIVSLTGLSIGSLYCLRAKLSIVRRRPLRASTGILSIPNAALILALEET